MHPVVRELERSADRASGVVDEDVHTPEVCTDLLSQRADGREVGEIAGVDVRCAAGGMHLGGGLVKLVTGSGHKDDLATRGAELRCQGRSDS